MKRAIELNATQSERLRAIASELGVDGQVGSMQEGTRARQSPSRSDALFVNLARRAVCWSNPSTSIELVEAVGAERHNPWNQTEVAL